MHTQAVDLGRIRAALLKWHRKAGMRAPWRESRDPYHALVAAVMAQQTQMSRVMPSYERFVSAFRTVDALAAATRGDVIRVWAGMGYNQRAVRLHNAARTIAASGWPPDAAALARIDGVGPFTAAIIASFAFGQRAACVDTNVRRVLGRLTGDESIDGRRLQTLADEWIPGVEPARWNQALMDYGARVCKARPRCGDCVVAGWCRSRDRYAAPASRIVADKRAEYRARASRGPAERRFEESPRYFRGRIVDTLRALTPGRWLALEDLPGRIAGTATAPPVAEVRSWVDALAEQGLLEFRGERVRLPR